MNKSLRYIERFFKLNTAPEILAEKVFPNLKEITESMGMFVAIQKHISFDRKDRNIHCVVVGDGHTPRTGMLIARLTAWEVYSIDPVMRLKNYHTDRLCLFKKKIEHLKFYFEKVVIVAVHSHANPKLTWNAIKADEKYFINIPCCVPDQLVRNPIVKYKDNRIHSPHNEVQIYYKGK